ncbi:MAG: protein kinase [Planctomycetes bacterium]|nr:protein kinase [Planctomycetota bacterium]
MPDDNSLLPPALPGTVTRTVTAKGTPGTVPQDTGTGAAPETAPAGTIVVSGAGQNNTIEVLVSVPGYEILGELGRGGMGVVYKARQQSLNRLVALKMILGAGTGDSPAVIRFLTEAEAVAAIRHPNVVQVYDHGQSCGQPFMALEYLAGGTLADKIRDGKRLEAREAAGVVEKIARGLQAAHGQGIIHRDIKPGNVLFDEGGEPKVADFGLAKRADSDLTRTGAIMGTPAYMAPEQADGHTREVGPAADVWSVGVILYECLTGTRPFVAKRTDELLVKVLMSDPDTLRSRSADVPRDLETICLKCLEKNPARRYTSALALAQDLERFQAGESILARPESALQKAWRRVRRRGLTISLVAALLIALGVASWLVIQSSSHRRVNDLSRQVDEGLKAAEWPEGHRDAMEQLVGQLETLDPAQAESARAKLLDRVAGRIRSVLTRSRVTPADVQMVEAELGWIASRDDALAKQLETEIHGRLRGWQATAELVPPFADTTAVLDPGSVRSGPGGLFPVTGQKLGSPTRTLLRSIGEVRFETEFGAGWYGAHEIGVAIDVSPGSSGYQFVFTATGRRLPNELAETVRTPGTKVTRETFQETQGHGEVRILRDGAVLRQQSLTLPTGPLQISAERDGDRLWVQVNQSEPLVFHDVAPIVGRADSVFGLVWPDAVPLLRLRTSNRPVPREPSRLEKADDLLSRGEYAAALLLYQQQTRSGDAGIATEARCKAGLCLVGLNRVDDAAIEFESVAVASGDRWPVMAVAQLALIRLQQKRFEDANSLFSVAAVRSTPEQVARYVPAAVRLQFLSQPGLPASSYVLPTEATVRRAEALYTLYELLGDQHSLPIQRYDLGRAHALIGENEKAERDFGDLLRVATSNPGTASGRFWLTPWSIRWLGWIKTRQDGADPALWSLAPALRILGLQEAKPTDPIPPGSNGVVVALARLHAMAGRRDIAEAYVEQVVNAPFEDLAHGYIWHAEAWLMRGFFAADKGDEAKARESWKRATFESYMALRNKAGVKGTATDNRGVFLYYRLLTGSLSGEMTNEEATEIWQRLLLLVTDDPLMTQMAATMQFNPSILKGMWASPRGREWARKVVFLDMHPVEFTRIPMRLIGYEKLRQDLCDGKPTPEQDEILWQTVLRFGDLFFEGKLSKVQMFPLALAWKGTAGSLGWGALASAVTPEARGPLAYAMGLRFVKLNKPADARGMFKTAIADAPAKSPLSRLAAEELAKLEGK